MNNSVEILICPSCKEEFSEAVEVCTTCKFPFNGSEKEKAIHIGQFINKKGVITDSDSSVTKSQNLLYAITGFSLLHLILNSFKSDYAIIDIIFNVALISIFFFCAFFIKKNPIVFSAIPLLLLMGIYSFNYLIEPENFLRGILFKILILGILIYNIYLVVKADNFKKKYNVRS